MSLPGFDQGPPHPLHAALAAMAEGWPQPPADVGPLGSGWRRAGGLFADGDAIDDLMAYQASFTHGLDRKGQAAFLITEYSHAFATLAAAPFVAAGMVPNLSADRCALAFDVRPVIHAGETREQRSWRFRLLDAAFVTDREAHAFHADARGPVSSAQLCDTLRTHVEDHFADLVMRLASRSGLPHHALWRLVADSIAGRCLDAGQAFGCLDHAKTMAMAVLKHPDSPLFNRQLQYVDITIMDADAQPITTRTFRARGGCCRFYTVEGGHKCSTCVLQKPHDRDRLLEASLRRQLGLAPNDGNAIATAIGSA